MKKRIKYGLLLAAVLVLFAFAAQKISQIQYNANSDKLVLRFAVTSKTNIYDEENTYFKNFIEKVYQYADAAPEYNNIDAFIINGNVTGNGNREAFEAFEKMSSDILRPESVIYTTMGEQDFITGETDEVSDPDIQDKIQDKVINIKGFSFIFMSPVYDSYESKYEWLDNTLNSISEYNDKPIFVFQYAAIKDTYYGTQDWYSMESSDLYNILEKYPTVVDFSSSAATAANVLTSVFRSNAAYVNSGAASGMRMKYEEYGNDLYEEIISEYANNASQCRIVEVYGDGHIIIKTMNLADGSICKMPQSDEEMLYCLVTGEKEDYAYADAPFFENTTVTLSELSDNSFEISFDNAKDNDGILFYNIKLYADKQLIKECNTYADYINGTNPKRYIFYDILTENDLLISITPYDIYGISGESLEYEFTKN
jgi:hypothetical protein